MKNMIVIRENEIIYIYFELPMFKVLDCALEVKEFELQSCNYSHFGTNTFGNGMETLILLAINSITCVLLQGWLWP